MSTFNLNSMFGPPPTPMDMANDKELRRRGEIELAYSRALWSETGSEYDLDNSVKVANILLDDIEGDLWIYELRDEVPTLLAEVYNKFAELHNQQLSRLQYIGSIRAMALGIFNDARQKYEESISTWEDGVGTRLRKEQEEHAMLHHADLGRSS